MQGFGEWVEKRRKELGIGRREDLAARTGIGISTINKIEGDGTLEGRSRATRVAIADALQVPVEELEGRASGSIPFAHPSPPPRPRDPSPGQLIAPLRLPRIEEPLDMHTLYVRREVAERFVKLAEANGESHTQALARLLELEATPRRRPNANDYDGMKDYRLNQRDDTPPPPEKK